MSTDPANTGGRHMSTDPVEWDVIETYSREQAIEDGNLVDLWQGDLEALCRQHYKYPICVTAAVWAVVEGAISAENECNDLLGVIHDILWMGRTCGRELSPSRREFEVTITGADPRRTVWRMWLDCGPGDDLEPVLTVGFPDDF